jgi:hypothetical protein
VLPVLSVRPLLPLLGTSLLERCLLARYLQGVWQLVPCPQGRPRQAGCPRATSLLAQALLAEVLLSRTIRS